ncbi:FAD-dependent oxidoreductase [Marinobacteraceae bacterium S3BR75-40.1]
MGQNHTDVAIVGGGLAGLALADRLQQAGVDYRVLEARDRWGGRIKSLTFREASFDVGPAWFWPIQPRIAALCRRFGLTVFEQHSDGDLLYENAERKVQRGVGYVSMEGSLRVEGGARVLVDRLAQALPSERLQLRAPVRRLGAEGEIRLASGERWYARRIVLALPPRVAAALDFSPDLSPSQRALLAAMPTWMGGHAKFLAIYDEPFWRREGLSGDAMSRSGPLMEIHDASPRSGSPGALFGFYGVPAPVRGEHREAVIDATLEQLERLFGPEARSPRFQAMQDWAFEPESATVADHNPPAYHPAYGLPPDLEGLWDGRLLFGASEMAEQYGGYMEGALERAECLADQLIGEGFA